jgi:hypothetical protein
VSLLQTAVPLLHSVVTDLVSDAAQELGFEWVDSELKGRREFGSLVVMAMVDKMNLEHSIAPT